MTSQVSKDSASALKSLWLRAPVWRFCLMSAALLTVMFVLFAPRMSPTAPVPTLAQATYHPLPAVAAALASSSPVATDKAKALSKIAAPQSHSSSPVGLVRPPKTSSTQAIVTPAVAPTTAQISLAPSGGAKSSDTSGVNAALMGRTFIGSIPINGFKLPLPPGNWMVLANIGVNLPTASGVAYYLARAENRHLVGAVRVFAMKSKETPGAGFKELVGCTKENTNNYFTNSEAAIPFDHLSCWFMYNYNTNALQQWADRAVNINPLDRAAAGDLAAKGVDYPQDLIGVRFTRAEKWGLLEANYLFSPETEGISSNIALSFRESDWHPENIQRFPEKVSYVAKLKDWGAQFWPKFQTAFDESK